MKIPIRLWVIWLNSASKKKLKREFKSGARLPKINAVPSNIFGYLIFNASVGAWCERIALGKDLISLFLYSILNISPYNFSYWERHDCLLTPWAKIDDIKKWPRSLRDLSGISIFFWTDLVSFRKHNKKHHLEYRLIGPWNASIFRF